MRQTIFSVSMPQRFRRSSAVAMFVAVVITSQASMAAIPCLDNALPASATDERSVPLLIAGGEALMASGLEVRGLAQLGHAARLASQNGELEDKAKAFGAYGHGLMLAGERTRALACLDASLDIAQKQKRTDLEALAHLNKGTLYTLDEERVDAAKSLAFAIEKSLKANRPDLTARALLNRATFFVDVVKSPADAVRDLEAAAAAVGRLEAGAEKVSLLLALGTAWIDKFPKDTEAGRYDRQAYEGLSQALTLADNLSLPKLRSSALGQLAGLYLRQDRVSEALRLLDQAIVEARQEKASGLIYRWHWDRAKLHKRLGDLHPARDDYGYAVDAVNDLRAKAALKDTALGRSPLQEARALFAEYVDLLFVDDADKLTQEELERIQEIVEQQRQVEVENYFQDDCVADLRSRITNIRDLELPGAGIALLYPIFSNNRLILMTSIAERLSYETIAASESAVRRNAQLLRRVLEASDSRPAEYLPTLQELHELLIAPIETTLKGANVDTLVIVPSGPLRGIPFAALHDGNDFLVKRYAVAITPGLSLLDSSPLAETSFSTLLGGLTKPVEGFDFLPFAEDEVERIRDLRGGTVLKDDDFVPGELQQSLAEIPYSVVHIASHAVFSERRDETFIVTQDGTLNLDQLEDLIKPSAFRDRPVELLTLSACETAAGDDLEQAALGLAGVAVKAGARSALGTLWPVFDISSPEFMTIFYQNIGPGGLSKAKALQQAQISMLDSDDFYHPAFWAPYLLIGNWR